MTFRKKKNQNTLSRKLKETGFSKSQCLNAFEMTLNKFEVKACDGMLKQLSPENDFERDMKVRSSTPGDRIQMDSCKRASEEVTCEKANEQASTRVTKRVSGMR